MRISQIQSHSKLPETNYSDIEVNWHKNYVKNGESLGIFNARSEKFVFFPDSGVQREEMIYLIDTLIQLY
jgi:hypothetical protein